jgi:hypothetical protein
MKNKMVMKHIYSKFGFAGLFGLTTSMLILLFTTSYIIVCPISVVNPELFEFVLEMFAYSAIILYITQLFLKHKSVS